MAAELDSGEQVSVGRVFSRGFGVIVDNPATVLGVAFLVGAVPSLLLNWLEAPTLASRMDSFQQIGSAALVLGSVLISLVLQALVQGSLVRATLAYVRGERATFGQCLRSSFSVFVPLVVLAILMGLAVFLGLAIFVVPGVMLYVMWAVASPVLVAERTGVFEAFGRSRALTKGARWKVFGVAAILIIAYYVFVAAVGAAMYAVGGLNLNTVPTKGLPIGWTIGTVLVSTIVNTVWSTVQTSLYVELRNWKEGLPEQTLEEVFA